MKTIFFTILILVAGSQAQADFLCEAESSSGSAMEITVQADQVVVTGAGLDKPEVYKNQDHSWDGHLTGLITAPGFAMKYDNAYGCLRNVTIIANVRSSRRFIQTLKNVVCVDTTVNSSACHK